MRGSAYGIRPAEMFGSTMTAEIDALRSSSRFDALGNPGFWQAWLAVQLGGEITAHRAAVDVMVRTPRREISAEVKFATSFLCAFSSVSGGGPRHIFRWRLSIPQVRRRFADALILIGLSDDRQIYSWVIPRVGVPHGRTITTTSPNHRMPGERGRWSRFDQYAVPADDLLPAFLLRTRENSPAQLHAKNAAATRRKQLNNGDLF